MRINVKEIKRKLEGGEYAFIPRKGSPLIRGNYQLRRIHFYFPEEVEGDFFSLPIKIGDYSKNLPKMHLAFFNKGTNCIAYEEGISPLFGKVILKGISRPAIKIDGLAFICHDWLSYQGDGEFAEINDFEVCPNAHFLPDKSLWENAATVAIFGVGDVAPIVYLLKK